MRITLFEDNNIQRKLARVVLLAAGHQVLDFATAEDGLASVHDEPPELVLVDLGLPGADGLEVANALKGDAITQDIPVVGITAFPEMYPRALAIEAGCDEYMLKPLETRQLSDQLESIFMTHKPSKSFKHR